MWGSQANTYLPRYLKIDKDFILGYSLYIAEGDTGLNGKTIPSKVRLVSADLPIIYFFKNWLIKYFKQNISNIKYYIYLPYNYKYNKFKLANQLNTNINNLHIYYDKTVTIPKYRISLERKIPLLIILKLDKIIKNLVIKDKDLASSYLEGISTGEGTAYCKRMKYVRIEMKNKTEIIFLSKLFNLIGINNTINKRGTRKDMWWVYIGKEVNLLKFSDMVGFKLKEKNQKILNKIVNHYSDYNLLSNSAT